MIGNFTYYVDSHLGGFVNPNEGLISPKCTVDLTVTSPRRHRIERIIVNEDIGDAFEIGSVNVGYESLLRISHGVDAALFTEDMPIDLRKIVCEVGMDLKIVATNISDTPKRFVAKVIAEVLPPIPRGKEDGETLYDFRSAATRKAKGFEPFACEVPDDVVPAGATWRFLASPQFFHVPMRLLVSDRIAPPFELVTARVGLDPLIDAPVKMSTFTKNGTPAPFKDVQAEVGHEIEIMVRNTSNKPARFSAVMIAKTFEPPIGSFFARGSREDEHGTKSE